MGRKITMFRITSIIKILILALAFQLNAQSLLLLEDGYELNSVPGLQLLVLPNRDLAGGWTSDNKVVQDYSSGGKQYGSELVVNGGFSAWTGDNPDGWTVYTENANNYITENSGKCRIVSDGTLMYATQGILELGKLYELNIEVTDVTAGSITITKGSVSSTAETFVSIIDAIGQYKITFRHDSGNDFLYLKRTTGVTDVTFDNVSVKEITNGNHGIYKNSMELNQTAGLKYYTFDGTDDYIDFGTDISLTNNFSISVLFKTTDNTFALVDKYDFGANQRAFQLIVSASGILEFYESPDGINAYTRKIDYLVPYNTGNVNFLTLTKSGATLKAYVNGVEKVVTFTDATTVPTLHASTAPLLSGARLNSGVPGYFGAMGKGFIAINTGALTLAQHQQIYYSSEIQSIIAGM